MKATKVYSFMAIVFMANLLFPSLSMGGNIFHPTIWLNNVKVHFISEREIEVSGEVSFTDLYSFSAQVGGLAAPSFDWTIVFDWIPKNGSFIPILGRHDNREPSGFTGTLRDPSDIGRSEWQLQLLEPDFLETPSFSEDGVLGTNGDEGKVFKFSKRFTIPDGAPAPYRYRVVAVLSFAIGGWIRHYSDHSLDTVFPPHPVWVYESFGPFRASPADISSKNVMAKNVTGRALLNLQTNTLHVPLLDAESLGAAPGKMWWVDFGLDILDSAPVFVIDLANSIGGIGVYSGYSPYTDLIATIDPVTFKLHIPEVDIGNGNTYWLNLRMLPVTGTRIAFAIDSYGLNPVDYSDALGNPCGSDAEFVRSLYQSVLDRDLDVSFELGHGAAHLQSLQDGATRESIILAFFHSSEYQNKQKSDEEFVRDVYQAVLGREPYLPEQIAGTAMGRDELLAFLFDSAVYQDMMAACGQ